MPRVLVAGKLHASGLAILRDVDGLDITYIEDTTTEAILPHIADADAILLRGQSLNAQMIADCPHLKLVSRHGVGYDAVDVDALNARGIALSIVGDVNAQAVAEHAMMLLLATSRRLITYNDAVRPDGNWNYRNELQAREVFEKTLLIVGLGRIGRRLAKMAAGFDIKVTAYDPYAGEPPDGVTMVDDFHEGLRAADMVSLHIPKADKPLIGEQELALMKPSAVVVNTARGGMVEEAALAQALNEGRLHGAGIDVFTQEPTDPANPLLTASQAILTPHSASMTLECAERMAVVSAQNIVDFFKGKLDAKLVVNSPEIGFSDR